MKGVIYRGSAAAAVALALLSGAAQAQEEDVSVDHALNTIGRPFYISPMASYTKTDSDRHTDDGFGPTLAIGARIYDFLALEASASYLKVDNQGDFVSQETKLESYGVNALMFPLRSTLNNLYLLLGAHYSQNHDQQRTAADGAAVLDDSTGWILNEGIGYLQPLSVFGFPFALRLEALYRHDQHSRDDTGSGKLTYGDMVFSAGIAFSLSPKRPAPPPEPVSEVAEVVPVAAPADSDGDGVTDDQDRCPDTPAGTQVDATGCPLPPPPPPPPCETPAPGQKVDFSGCAVGDTVVLRGVNFEFNKATLTVNAKTILDGVADALKSASAITVEVGGHTDAKGSHGYNQKLSEARAKSVVQYLTEHGIDASRMAAVGYAETQPVADNDSDEGRELNRRVALKITSPASAAPPASTAP